MSLTVLGATGSVGTSTLDLVSHAPGRFEIVALTGQSNVELLATLARRHRARLAVIGDERLLPQLAELLAGSGIETAGGAAAIVEAATRPADCVMASIMGAAGLKPTLAAVEQGRRVAIANKECLVCAGSHVMREVARTGAELVPVDSEHSAVFQALAGQRLDSVEQITITASGGPFRTWTMDRIAEARVEDALKHPNWTMGRKITIDSATLMNKGLELIEAFHLFPVGLERLGVVVHPQSIVHCLVSYSDGSVIAQMAAPDMRTPIAFSLAWPERMSAPTARLDLAKVGSLTFEPPDERRFPALRLARAALERGGTATCILNAANEVAVEAFLDRRLRFLDIARIVEECLNEGERRRWVVAADGLAPVLEADAVTRDFALAKVVARGASAAS